MPVTIGIDPHKSSRTAVALDEHEDVLGQLRVRSGNDQLARLAEWAKAWPERTWAIENASGLGYLLTQQLVSAGERVVDVQPKLAARARLLDTGDVNKNDPNDARSVAVAAMGAKRLAEVAEEDHTAVMKLWARRRKFLTSTPIEVSSGPKKLYRLSLRGNRQLDHALHMAAITRGPLPPQRGPCLLRPQSV
jgi:transposase